MTNLLQKIWKYFDVICIVLAICFAIWGCFLLNFVAGIFAIAVGLLALALLSEWIAKSLS